MLLLEGENIQAALYQVYLVAESLAAQDPIGACRVIGDCLEVCVVVVMFIVFLLEGNNKKQKTKNKKQKTKANKCDSDEI